MSAPFFVTGREHRPVLKSIGRVLIGALVFNALSPLSVLAQDKPVVSAAAERQRQQLAALNQRIEQAKAERSRSPAERLTRDFQQAQDLVRTLHADTRSRAPRKPGEPDMEVRAVGPDIRIQAERSALDKLSDERRADSESRLREHLRTLSSSRSAARADFDTTRRELLAKRVPAEILARHDAAVRDFEQRVAQFERASQAWSGGPEEGRPAALAELDDFFKRYPASRTAAPLDPKKLPWRTPEPTTRQPADTQTAWFRNLWGTPQVKLAAAGNVGPISFDVMPEPGQLPTEADLAATPETQLTPALTAKATELGNNPLNIHNWVRNNVDWLPSWGAVQSADDTLAKKRGNAHDIASLEIALLRAAKVPARYQYGTIEVDADKLQNWVGGASKVEAAQQILGQGGIANRGLVQGGRVATVRMEHVWVSAYVNWLPGRGAKQGAAGQHVNPIGSHNTWVPLDASYKQYSYVAGPDLRAAVPVDTNALLNAAQIGATVNTQEGWVQNVNRAAIQGELSNYQTRLQTYLDGQNNSAAIGDVVGKKIIPVQLQPLLAGSLPYRIVQAGQLVAAVPAAQQHQFRFQLFRAQEAGFDDAAPVLSFQQRTSQLGGKRLSLTYVPATQADADLMASYLPKAHSDGSPIQPGEVPTSFPGYLIRLKPQVMLDGQVVAQSSEVFTMGTDLISSGGFTRFGNLADWDVTTAESNTVGQGTAIGLSLQGVSAAQVVQLRTQLDAIRSQLQAKNFSGLTGEQISGGMLTAAIWGWFAAAESHNRLSQNNAGIIENPGLSYGLFHAVAQPIYSWGVVRQVKFPGVNMDIPHVRNLTVSKSSNQQEWVGYNRLRGQYMSALEHAVPDRLFGDTSKCNVVGFPQQTPGLPACPQGVSAVRALGIAAGAGQKVFVITPQVYSDNPGIVQTRLSAHSADTKARIQSYLDAGFEVNVHEKPIAESGWTGAGFVAIDTSTGAGAYLIDGGANGAFREGAQMAIMVAIDIALYAFTIPTGGAATAFPAYMAIILAGEIARITSSYAGDEEALGCFWGGFFFALGGIAILAGILTGGVLAGVTFALITWLLPGIFIPTNTALQCKAFFWQS